MSRLLLAVAAALAVAPGLAGAAASEFGSSRERGRSPDPAARSAKVIHLKRTPAAVIAQCRRVQAKARFPMLCPRVLPRALIGWPPGQPPPPLRAGLIDSSPRRGPDGVDIGYGAPWEIDPGSGQPAAQVRPHLWRNRPCCFLHLVVQRGAPAPGARPTMLGGRRGRLLAATTSGYSGPYFGNHVRFFFRERGVSYVVTLHTFGKRETTSLLGKLIAELRPVMTLRPPAPPRQGTTVRIGSAGPRAMVAAPGSLWVLSRDQPIYPNRPWTGTRATLLRLESWTGAVSSRISLAGGVRGVAATETAVWVAAAQSVSATREEGVVLRLHHETKRVVARTRTGTWPSALAADAAGVWAVNTAPFYKRGTLVRIDAATNQLDGPAVLLGRAPSGLAVGGGSVWVADSLEGTVRRIDPVRRRVISTIRVGRQPYALAFTAGSVWVTNTDDGTVSRIDPHTNKVVATIRVGRNPHGIAAVSRSLWVANLGDGTVSRIDATSRRVVETVHVGADPIAVAPVGESVWVARNSEGALTRFDRPRRDTDRPLPR